MRLQQSWSHFQSTVLCYSVRQPHPSVEMEKLLQMRDHLTAHWVWKEDKCHLMGNQVYRSKNFDMGARAKALVTSPCLTPHFIGNRIAMYFEFFLCARTLGLNYISVHKIDHRVNESHAFFQALPDVATNVLRTGPFPNLTEVKTTCPCDTFCHDKKHALIFDHIDVPIEMFRVAIDAYWADRTRKSGHLLHQTMAGTAGSTIHLDNISTAISGKTAAELNIPSIPDVAIHYRVGSVLFAYDYGFLPYWAVGDRIPLDSKTIYIVSDSPHRHEEGNDTEDVNVKKKAFGQPVLEGLMCYLRGRFRTSIVLLLRGQEPMDDLARLSLAKVTICSPSTYCFWPAISSRTKSYFPKTPIINAGETRNIRGSFNWMHDEYIRGLDVNVDAGPAALVTTLSTRP
jgi:hypothetical protein